MILHNYTENSKIGDYIALIYDDEGDPLGSMEGSDLRDLIEHLEEVTKEKDYHYILLEVIDNFRNKTFH